MRRAALAFLVSAILLPAACAEPPRFGRAEAPVKQPGAVRLATYNVLNLFDQRDDPSLSGNEDDMSSVKPDSEKQGVADAIRRLDADILALQEVESFDALIEFREQYLQGMGYKHVVSFDVGAERGIEQAVLSRHPITEALVWPTLALEGVHPEQYGSEPNRYAGQALDCRRSPLRVTIDVPGAEGAAPYRLTLFVVHHKSGRYNNYWREAEAVKFAELIADLQASEPSRNIALLGDFNAMPIDVSVQSYVSAGLTDVLAPRTARDPATTTHESGRAIDFILVNPALLKDLVPSSAFVLGTPLRPEGADYRTTPAPAGFGSDHLPVAVDFLPRDN